MASKDCIKVSVSLPREILDKITKEAESRDLTRSRMISKACEFMLKVLEGGYNV